jgi:hypothetical protein
MTQEPYNISNLILGPETTGKSLIPQLRAALEEDKKRREEQIEDKVRIALTQALQTLIARAKSAVPDNPESVDQIATFLNVDKVLKSALTSGSIGKARVEEVFTRARFYIEDYLRNPRWANASPESKIAIQNLGDYLHVAADKIVKELEDVRSLKAGIAQQSSRVKKILDAISDPRDIQDLYDRAIPNIAALASWVSDVGTYFMNADAEITRVGKSFRPAYIKAWQDFIETHFPLNLNAQEGETFSNQSVNRFEHRLSELLSEKLLQTSMDEFQKVVLTSGKFRNNQEQTKENSNQSGKSQPVIPMEMRASATRVEIILRIPENQTGNLNRIQNEAFLDLNDIIDEHEASIRIDSRNLGRDISLIIVTRDTSDREWISQLQKLAEKIASSLATGNFDQ